MRLLFVICLFTYKTYLRIPNTFDNPTITISKELIKIKITFAYSSHFSSSSCFCTIVTNQPTSYIYSILLPVTFLYLPLARAAAGCTAAQVCLTKWDAGGGVGWEGRVAAAWFVLSDVAPQKDRPDTTECSGSTFQNIAAAKQSKATFEWCSKFQDFDIFFSPKKMIFKKMEK